MRSQAGFTSRPMPIKVESLGSEAIALEVEESKKRQQELIKKISQKVAIH